MRGFLRIIELVILAVIATVASILAVLSFFQVFIIDQYQIPLISLFLLGALCLHLIFTHFRQEDFRKDTSNVLKHIETRPSLNDFRVFNDSTEIEKYLGKRILEAKKSVYDLTWKTKISSGFSASIRQLAHNYMDQCIAQASDRIEYREIFIFNDLRRVEKFERRLAENKIAYSCKYFEVDLSIPRLQFVIVDEEEVFFFASSSKSPLCSFYSKELCSVFTSYYEALWEAATEIKDGPKIDFQEVKKLRVKFAEMKKDL